ncbi:MAG TPA: TerD family protein [Solirubrobacteraceae bacterium]|jgi:tellurite resistance protein TerA
MSSDLAMGANTTLSAPAGELTVRHRADSVVDVNLTAFLVGADDKVRGDADMVFFNQPTAEGASARYEPPATSGGVVTHRLAFDLSRLPAGVEKIVVTLTEDAGPGFAAVADLVGTVVVGGQEQVRLFPAPAFKTEKGIVVAELYVRGGANKVRAVWQGYSSGLHGLATAHGVDVESPAAASAPNPPAPAPAAAAVPTVNFKKVSGNINLRKGDAPVIMEKTAKITASVSWRSGTDYDVYALVMTKDGTQVDVATFGAKGVKKLMNYGNGAVKHLGDVQRATGKKLWGAKDEQKEIVEIRLTSDVVAVVPVAYSAQSNGSGSFHRYKVSLSIDNGSGTNVSISADSANNDDRVYSCVPGIIRNMPDGVVIEPLELYSKPGSEKRPRLRGRGTDVTVEMDAGPKNDYK